MGEAAQCCRREEGKHLGPPALGNTANLLTEPVSSFKSLLAGFVFLRSPAEPASTALLNPRRCAVKCLLIVGAAPVLIGISVSQCIR